MKCRFYGKGKVWDKDLGKELVAFPRGPEQERYIETDDKRIIGILSSMKFKCEILEMDTVVPDPDDIPSPAKAAEIEPEPARSLESEDKGAEDGANADGLKPYVPNKPRKPKGA